MLQVLKNYQLNYLKQLKTSYKRYIHKEVDFRQKLIGIVGARGVGKTTFLLQYHKENTYRWIFTLSILKMRAIIS